MRRGWWILKIAVFGLLAVALFGLVTQALWNWLVPVLYDKTSLKDFSESRFAPDYKSPELFRRRLKLGPLVNCAMQGGDEMSIQHFLDGGKLRIGVEPFYLILDMVHIIYARFFQVG